MQHWRQTSVLLLMALLLSPLSFAGPQFSRQYNTSCSTCHTVFAQLNDLGKAFMDAGFRFPESDEALLERPHALLVPSHLPVNMGEQSQRSFDAIPPSRVPKVEAGAVQKKCLTKLEILRRELESYRFPYRLCLTTELGEPAAMRCVNQHSIRFGTLNGDKVLEITGNYYAAYSGRKLDANQRAGLTLRAVLLPILTMAVAQFRNDRVIQGYAVEVSHYVRAEVLGIPWERPENVAVVLPSTAAERLVEAKDPREQQIILQQGQVFLNADPFTLTLVPTTRAN